MRNPRAMIFFVLVALVFIVPVYSQSMTGNLLGTVTSDGSPLPGVSVTASSPALQGTRTAITGEAGGYYFPSLPPGNYTIAFDLSGMQRVAKKVTVSVAQTSRADVAMTVASVKESITVTAAASPVAESTTVASNFTSAEINELPIGRTIDSVTLMAPGVNSAGPNSQIVISGAGSYDSLFLVDGVVVNENLRGQPQPLYIEDAIQETTVLSGGISAEFGRFTGGVVTSLTKSGGNDFSGSFRDAMTNPSWSSLTAYSRPGQAVSALNNAYEGTFGGRVIRDRLWFFGAGRYTKSEATNQTVLTNIPYLSTSTNRRFETKLTGQVNAQNSVGRNVHRQSATEPTCPAPAEASSIWPASRRTPRRAPCCRRTTTESLTNWLLLKGSSAGCAIAGPRAPRPATSSWAPFSSTTTKGCAAGRRLSAARPARRSSATTRSTPPRHYFLSRARWPAPQSRRRL